MLRRIKRRMHVHSVESLEEYLTVLNEDSEEPRELFKDMLISVTNFFRDPEAYDALEDRVITKLFEGKNQDDELRVWVPGCATGEEAYSVAMLLHKYARNISQPPSIQIFATDIDEHALDVARQGRYPESIAGDLTQQRLQRFFTKYGYEYVVKEELRNLILFSKHDLLRHPPFLNQDLISCRNLLIYLDRDLQSAVFNLFHYALKPKGRLFLGSSDSNLQATEQFKPIDKNHRIYQRRSGSKSIVQLPSFPLKFSQNKPSGSHSWKMPSKTKSNFQQLHRRLMTQQYAPPSVIINENEEVLHATTGIGQYVNYTEGEPSRKILDMVISDLRQPLRSILYQIKKDEEDLPIHKHEWIKKGEQSQLIMLHVDRIREKDFPDDLIHIVFQKKRETEDSEDEVRNKKDVSEEEAEIIKELENELKQTKEQLEVTVQDYETSNEELRSSNEELQSMNEELQSTTEELETSKEELQSVNEELRTVNRELEAKIDDLSQANSDLKNLMDATEIAIVFVDRDFCLKRFTSNATDIFNLTPADIDRPLEHFTHQLKYDSLMADIENVLDNLEKSRKEVVNKQGNSYIMRMRPYQTVDGNINGVVISLVDITELKEAEEELTDKVKKIKKLQREIISNDVSERWRIGQYLHDDLGQSLVSAKILLESLKTEVANGEKKLTENFDQLIDIIDHSMDGVRDLSHQIVPVDIKEKGVTHAFNNFAKQLEKNYDIHCELDYDHTVDKIEDIEIATHLYNIINESAKNAAVHGDAKNVQITLQSDDQYLYLNIADDGAGFSDDDKEESGIGIHLMRHRMELIGGTLEVKNTSKIGDNGVTVSCTIPIEKIKGD